MLGEEMGFNGLGQFARVLFRRVEEHSPKRGCPRSGIPGLTADKERDLAVAALGKVCCRSHRGRRIGGSRLASRLPCPAVSLSFPLSVGLAP